MLYIIGVCGLVFLKLIVMNFLPGIFRYLDIIMLFFVMAIMRGAGGGVVWFAFSIYTVLDILNSHIFGIELFAGVFSVLGIFWFFEEVFTNLSIWTAGILSMFGMTVFKTLFCLLSVILGIIYNQETIVSLGLIKQFGIEIVTTSLLSVPLYAVLMKIGNMVTREKIKYS